MDNSSDAIHTSRRRSRLSRATDEDFRGEASVPNDSESVSIILLFIFRLLHTRGIHSLDIPRRTKFNIRRALGIGGSYSVEETYIPLDAQSIQETFRSRDAQRHFIDHTGTAWSRDTLVAYKKSAVTAATDIGFSRRRLDDALTELRVLSHPPLWSHPNIVRLLGIAWVADEILPNSERPETPEPRESFQWPSIVLEKSQFGSLLDFLGAGEHMRIRPSLASKFRLCLDVLRGLAVCFRSDWI